MNFIARYASSLGELTLSSDGEVLTGLQFGGGEPEKDAPVFDTAKRWLDLYFQGVVPDFTPPLRLRGSCFQTAVWNILMTIPFGKTMTYGEIAARFPARMSAQAVGGAVGRNPVLLIVPCHRVVGKSGKITGYSGGADKKIRLLELENSGQIRSDFFR